MRTSSFYSQEIFRSALSASTAVDFGNSDGLDSAHCSGLLDLSSDNCRATYFPAPTRVSVLGKKRFSNGLHKWSLRVESENSNISGLMLGVIPVAKWTGGNDFASAACVWINEKEIKLHSCCRHLSGSHSRWKQGDVIEIDVNCEENTFSATLLRTGEVLRGEMVDIVGRGVLAPIILFYHTYHNSVALLCDDS